LVTGPIAVRKSRGASSRRGPIMPRYHRRLNEPARKFKESRAGQIRYRTLVRTALPQITALSLLLQNQNRNKKQGSDSREEYRTAIYLSRGAEVWRRPGGIRPGRRTLGAAAYKKHLVS
jgi:hypothetical protein